MRAGRLLDSGTFRPEPARTLATVFQCSLCGTRFSHDGRVCGGCPFHTSCGLVRCPGCGYEFPRGSHLVDWLGRLWERMRRRH